MGLLIDGVWHDKGYETAKNKGQFIRAESNFRNWITRDGAAGPSGEEGFAAEPGRYHLYVCFACPWAHRTLIMRRLKALDGMIEDSFDTIVSRFLSQRIGTVTRPVIVGSALR